MREIEFRGKTDENIWVFGNFVKTKEEYTKEISNAIINLDAEHRCCGEYLDNGWNEIDINTLGQYTGLKDKNGTKIFEGDIVQLTRTKMRAPTASFNGQDIVSKHLIYWDEERHAFHQKHYTEERCIGGGSIDFEDVRAEENIIEVIGNIHDNPELLKE